MQLALRLNGFTPRPQRATGRRPFDFYPTGAAVTRALLERIDIGGRVLEPCAGAGDMARVLRDDPRITAVATSDIDPARPVDFYGNAADPGAPCYTGGRYDWIVTNPPYTRAAPILATAYDQARIGVAFLLRLTFLEPARDRAAWLQAHTAQLSDQLILNPRPSFTGDGRSDSATVAWLVWRRGHRGGTRIHFVTDWKR